MIGEAPRAGTPAPGHPPGPSPIAADSASRSREWVDDAAAQPGDLEALAGVDEVAWREQTARFLRY